ncbi:MAG TPA: hypothetical protein VGU20_01195 [Stellaceae bacterium]|nr:hypothetical protein [Stellaceae bacterium]
MGDEWVSLTTERDVAEHFADMAVFGDQDDRAPVPIMESDPVVLLVDGEGLLKLNYDLQAINCDDPDLNWEKEIACMEDIAPFDKVLIDVVPVAPDPSIDLGPPVQQVVE